MRWIEGVERCSWCLLADCCGVGGDSLLIHLCRNLLKVGLQAKGVGSAGRFLLLTYMGGCLTICEACPPCLLSEWVSHCFSCSLMIGLIAWLCLLVYFLGVVSMVLVLWEFVLFYKMDVEFKGQIFLIFSRRVKWK